MRAGEVAVVRLAVLEDDAVRCFGVGRRLLRRVFIALAGRATRRAIGLSSFAVLSSSSSARTKRRPDAGVPVDSCDEEPGVEREATLPRAGVEGDCIGLANGRLAGCCAGVVDAGRLDGGGERAEERLSGLRTGMPDWLETLLNLSESRPLRNGEGVVNDMGLKLCPTIVSRMFVLEFQGGFTAGLSVAGVMERRVGVKDEGREGVISRRGRGGLRATVVVVSGTLEYRRFVGGAGFDGAKLD